MLTYDELNALNDVDFNFAIAALAGYHEDFANDLNAAWALCANIGEIGIARAAANGRFGIGIKDYDTQETYWYPHKLPARGLASAWYRWKGAQDG
jgi:hypothetical protein